VLLLPLVATASAQVCECAMFLEGYENQQIPIEYLPQRGSGNYTCDDPTDCEQFCLDEYSQIQSRSMCFNHPTLARRCSGSLYCEILHNQNATSQIDAPGKLRYRVLACDDLAEWQDVPGAEPTAENLCCNEGLFCGDCNNPANKPCYEIDLCEGGVFITDQFDNGLIAETNPLPVQYMSENLKASFDCPYIPGENPNSRCDRFIGSAVDDFFGSLDLDEERPIGGITWGQSYCGALYQRWGLEWPMEGINSTIEVRSRMPECNLFWGDYVWDYHTQRLCCDGEGFYQGC